VAFMPMEDTASPFFTEHSIWGKFHITHRCQCVLVFPSSEKAILKSRSTFFFQANQTAKHTMPQTPSRRRSQPMDSVAAHFPNEHGECGQTDAAHRCAGRIRPGRVPSAIDSPKALLLFFFLLVFCHQDCARGQDGRKREKESSKIGPAFLSDDPGPIRQCEAQQVLPLPSKKPAQLEKRRMPPSGLRKSL
jgi:hypothetical protein